MLPIEKINIILRNYHYQIFLLMVVIGLALTVIAAGLVKYKSSTITRIGLVIIFAAGIGIRNYCKEIKVFKEYRQELEEAINGKDKEVGTKK